MERIIKITGKILGTLFLLTALVTCKDPTNLLEGLEDEVKMANDLYLEIVDISVEDNEDSFDPGNSIEITFDREIDMEVLSDYLSLNNEDGVPFTSEAGINNLNYSFNTTNNVLTITPEPYLNGLVKYILTMAEGFMGTDGSILRDSHTVGFRTLDTPRGYLVINDEYSNAGDKKITVEVHYEGATYYELSDHPDFENGTGWHSGWISTADRSIITDPDAYITGTQGENTIYGRFRDGDAAGAASANISITETATIIYDTVPPNVDIAGNDSTLVINKSNSYPFTLDGLVSDGTSGILSYSWSDLGTGSTSVSSFNSTNLNEDASVSLSTDGTCNIQLEVSDKAGNTNSSTISINQDRTLGFTTLSTAPNKFPNIDTTIDFSLSTYGSPSAMLWNLDDGSWNSISTSTTSLTVTVPYGNPEVSFRIQDPAGNDITVSKQMTIVPPDGTVYPAHKSTVSDKYFDLAWYSSVLYPYTTYYYAVYIGTVNDKTKMTRFPVDGLYRSYPISTPYVDHKNIPLKLTAGDTYYWCIVVYNANSFDSRYIVEVQPGTLRSENYYFTYSP